MLCKGNDFPVTELPVKVCLYHGVRYAVKKLAEIKQQHISLCTIPAVVLLQMLRETPDCKVIALSLKACAAVIDERSGQHRNQCVIA